MDVNGYLAYDEEDDGFAFTRTRSKKQKAEPPQPPIVEESLVPPPKHTEPAAAASKKTKKRFEDRPSAGTAGAESPATKAQRSTRNSGGGQEDADPPPLAMKKRRKGRDSDEQTKEPAAPKDAHKDRNQDQAHGRQDKTDEDHTHPIEITFDATKIALPFADTPIIRRNQEMRKGIASGNGKRRSSLGMRGRRASSLIDTGKSNGADQ